MKKGFTLVELLGVIIILGVIALITFPLVNNSIKNSKEKALEQIIYNIETAAYEYSIKNQLLFSPVYNKIELSTLTSAGILKENIINPITDEQMQGCVLYKWIDDYNQFEFKYDENCSIKTIGDAVLEKFPYLETKGNGCVTSTENNYSYMGGCYLKGGENTNEEYMFYYRLINLGIFGTTEEEIRDKFFDDGNFKLDNFERAYREYAMSQGVTEEQLDEQLQQMGYDTFFEVLFQKKPEEIFIKLDNYIWYSGFLWRIMGINADGTIKLIVNENVTAIPFGKNGSALDWDGSYVRNWLNEYFYSKLRGQDLITKQIWCSEKISSESSSYTTKRNTCSNNLSVGTSKVGLITLDEYNLAGGTESYLNIGQDNITITPANENLIGFIHSDGTDYSVSDVVAALGVRPIINVKSVGVVTGGDGSITSNWNNNAGPYILNEDKNIEVTGKLNEKATSGEYVLFSNKKYRVIDKDADGNIKLILDEFYEESGKKFGMPYGNNNIFTTSSGVGQKLNNDVLKWLIPDGDNVNESKLVKNYTWYQTELSVGYDYKLSFEENDGVIATVGLIRMGEMLSGQSGSIITKNYTMSSTLNNGYYYWTMNQYTNNIDAWYINYEGYSNIELKIGSIDLSNRIGLRPVIVIKSDVDIISGTGTWSNPYQI